MANAAGRTRQEVFGHADSCIAAEARYRSVQVDGLPPAKALRAIARATRASAGILDVPFCIEFPGPVGS